jgi:hypothetical protein
MQRYSCVAGHLSIEVVTSLNPTPLAGKTAVILDGTGGIAAANPKYSEA